MKKTNRVLGNEEGFTLIELMVVVAIIGVLVTVALPQYQGYMSRARQTEAKLSLGSVATAERSIFAEHNTYTACLSNVGVAAPSAPHLYAFGLSALTTVNTSSGSVSCNPVIAAGTHYFVANAQVPGGTAGVQTVVGVSSAILANDTRFVIGASGDISVSAAAADDWSIDEKGNLLNVAANL